MREKSKLLVCFSVLLLSGASFWLASCATIIHGTRQEIGFSSSPTGAIVFIDKKELAKTPFIASLTRKDKHLVRIEMPGYEPFEMLITKKVSGWVWGNIVFGGLIGLIVDAVSGGIYELNPGQVQAALSKKQFGFLHKQDFICVAVALKPEPGWRKIGNLTPAIN